MSAPGDATETRAGLRERTAADLLAEVLLIHRPDWEAVCRGCSGGERWPCNTHELTTAALAALPGPHLDS